MSGARAWHTAESDCWRSRHRRRASCGVCATGGRRGIIARPDRARGGPLQCRARDHQRPRHAAFGERRHRGRGLDRRRGARCHLRELPAANAPLVRDDRDRRLVLSRALIGRRQLRSEIHARRAVDPDIRAPRHDDADAPTPTCCRPAHLVVGMASCSRPCLHKHFLLFSNIAAVLHRHSCLSMRPTFGMPARTCS